MKKIEVGISQLEAGPRQKSKTLSEKLLKQKVPGHVPSCVCVCVSSSGCQKLGIKHIGRFGYKGVALESCVVMKHFCILTEVMVTEIYPCD
jgi:hypothetical protein